MLAFKNQYEMCVLIHGYASGEMYGSVNQNHVHIRKLYMYCIAEIRHYHMVGNFHQGQIIPLLLIISSGEGLIGKNYYVYVAVVFQM